ncbi:GTPase, G3E family protein [Gloeocapsopsis sp. AAB1 = 1H9]|uniref:GTPase, G3E family protein n=1 Tax=Gloeocapsopsis dulcis AAB1 = 1H9 TaxID=1433147 RepID=A0A6N8FX31_9CHRO|nr:GTPase, G3E family protein [Gloeocapsopsis dulcis AAB1 = 1H9]
MTAVAGLPGVGKTNWIRQQLTQQPTLYFSPATRIGIDQTRLAAEFPHMQFLADDQQAQLGSFLASGVNAYLELGYHLDLAQIAPILDTLNCHRVAIVPAGMQETSDWEEWADEMITGSSGAIDANSLWVANTTGHVIDPDSLEVFWYELTQGAYGTVSRAKGIFELVDGLSVYGDFVAGLQPQDFDELNLPRWLEGRPQRLSGIEVWGNQLDEAAIAQTFQDCCLSDAVIHHYQQQVKEILSQEAMV